MFFSGSIVPHQARIASDHAPLILEIDQPQFVSPGKNLKFEEAWMIDPNVHSVALGTWRKPATGDPNKILEVKCARTTKALARRSKFDAKSESVRARKLADEINVFQMREAAGPLSEDLGSLRSLVANYNEIQTKLDVLWWQRAKNKWLKDGDRNSAFFSCRGYPAKAGKPHILPSLFWLECLDPVSRFLHLKRSCFFCLRRTPRSRLRSSPSGATERLDSMG
ncbi:hypothetical protein KSP39_PZI014723 [Platanthera zijinensis]|uniref:Uncharacterized protein n=1 Tax=Platanthera zijinensis TaxID=2320716 RepID=A0AAP0BBL8_9ASPA